jgi:hypothetical protein
MWVNENRKFMEREYICIYSESAIFAEHLEPEMYIHLYKFTFRLWIRPWTDLSEHCDILYIHNLILGSQQCR